jgi:hypothetical protein
VGVGSSIDMDVIAVTGQETSAPTIGDIAIYDVYFHNNEQTSAQAAKNKNAGLIFFQLIICPGTLKGLIFDGLATIEIIHAVLNGHLAVFTII